MNKVPSQPQPRPPHAARAQYGQIEPAPKRKPDAEAGAADAIAATERANAVVWLNKRGARCPPGAARPGAILCNDSRDEYEHGWSCDGDGCEACW